MARSRVSPLSVLLMAACLVVLAACGGPAQPAAPVQSTPAPAEAAPTPAPVLPTPRPTATTEATPTPTVPPPTATAEATPAPTAPPPAPTLPRPTTTPTAMPGLTLAEYAAACGDLVAREGEMKFDEWVVELAALRPPPEVAAFHEATSAQFTGQSNGGPNAETQAAYDRRTEILVELPAELLDPLFEAGCLREVEIVVAQNILAAKARVAARGPQVVPVTVEDYAQRCADITRTVPIMGGWDAFTKHIIDHWRELIPPAGFEDYHAALLAVYLEMEQTREVDLTSETMTKAATEATKLGNEAVGILTLASCIGR